jgi:acyl carrier protein
MEARGTTGDVEARIGEFLSHFFRNRQLEDDEDLFELGFVNSLLAMQLVLFVEKEFSVTVGSDDLDLDNFRSIRAISHLVARKRGVAG